MKINQKDYRAVWAEGNTVYMIDQILLPFEFKIVEFKTYSETVDAIKDMVTRGAGSIGAAAGFAMAQAAYEAPDEIKLDFLKNAKHKIMNARPTARDLFAAVDRVFPKAVISFKSAMDTAQEFADEIVEAGKKIGVFGNELIKENANILTHCNAGWLALVDYGSALAPIYEAFRKNKNPFVFVDETRPRSQGARLTAWELNQQGVNHAIIADNAAAWYMSQGKIDLLITGADRITANGDVANKIGTLEKAIAANYYGIPFYVAAPLSTFDFYTASGSGIIIEERDENEVIYQTGLDENEILHNIKICSPGSKALNPAFDVTPSELISGYITKLGVFKTVSDLQKMI